MKISILPLSIPFKSKFSHASYERAHTESFFVKATEDNEVGFGESCPRMYVTGETIKSCNLFITHYADNISHIKSMTDLMQWVNENSKLIDTNPAAWCALEMAIIDVFAKVTKQPASKILGLEQHEHQQYFSAIVGYKSLKKALLFKLMGFSDFKLKIGSSIHSNKIVIKLMRLLRIYPSKVRLDANNLWTTPQDCIDNLSDLKGAFWALEEPIKPFDYEGMVKVAYALDCKIILDESFITPKHVADISKYKDVFIANVRISKLGGVLRTIQAIRMLTELDIPFILGSHVGESSLLGNAQQVIFQSCKQPCLAVEGGFSNWLLKRDPFQPQLKVGYGGVYPQNKKEVLFGWGVHYEK
ncbi:hypothetical protein CXF85_06180 [Colwellia sp. 75C3]|uniref:enolase C-terminal domain-like protein n=1 Tax=Colwellia sp. 75C3 TaxID=888425 RepID=UPI000C339A2B|nr:enolase C-terminal domain-like protein [Colwellia sp. 75C3]PKG85185.1 hypothetical protein CXF85_06180 [Colwellia sp. 75C3]